MEAFGAAILYHNYYSLAGIDELRARIEALKRRDILLLCSLPDKFFGNVPRQGVNERFVLVPNAGKDIGGKLALIQLLLTLYPDTPYAVLLHDKRSYQKHSGRWEKQGLFRIVEPELFGVIESAFERDALLGIACSRGFVRNEYLGGGRFNTTNSGLLNDMIKKYDVSDRDLRFIAGTMFWIRTSLLKAFFSGETPLDVRGMLEPGNVLDDEKGTMTHCWERMLSWIATGAGYKIKEF